MRFLLPISLFLSSALFLRASESPNDIAIRIIGSDRVFIVAGQVGTNPYNIPDQTAQKHHQNDEAAKAAKILQDYMLSSNVSEKIRICYALTVLEKRRSQLLNSDRKDGYWKDRLSLGARLLEIRKAEQGAAANP
jgi:hypothetical protein